MPSAIEWTEETWNPVTGCSKVSPGCAYCYAERMSLRFGWSSLPWTPENASANVVLHPERLDQPRRWRRPKMVFVNSMSDLFHELIPREFLDRVFATMALAPQHTFQVLTKRPEVAADYFGERPWLRVSGRAFELNRYSGIASDLHGGTGWPLPNVWLGVSIENARWTQRADVLREIPAAVRFVSAEPLLGSLGDSLDLSGIGWLIVGGESGLGARPMKIEWARELRDAARAAGTAFFFKQWGGATPKAGGRLLDGREWSEMPTARVAT